MRWKSWNKSCQNEMWLQWERPFHRNSGVWKITRSRNVQCKFLLLNQQTIPQFHQIVKLEIGNPWKKWFFLRVIVWHNVHFISESVLPIYILQNAAIANMCCARFRYMIWSQIPIIFYDENVCICICFKLKPFLSFQIGHDCGQLIFLN